MHLGFSSSRQSVSLHTTLFLPQTFSANGQSQEVVLQSQMAVTSLLVVESVSTAASTTETPQTTNEQQTLEQIPEEGACDEQEDTEEEEQEEKQGELEDSVEEAPAPSSRQAYQLWCGCGNRMIILDSE